MTETTGTTGPAVCYRGSHTGTAGPGAVEVVENGQVTGLLHHVVRHSPTGFSWGYEGSGPADLALSLLTAALGEDAKCPACAGTREVVWLLPEPGDTGGSPRGPVPFGTARGDRIDPDLAGRCFDCDNGYRPLPYQEFKRQFVARFGDEFCIDQGAILAWYASQGGSGS